MNYVIDTSSLKSLVDYYLPFDKDGALLDFISGKITSHEIVVLDRVYNECKGIAKGIIIDSIGVLKQKESIIKTENILPTRRYLRMLESNFTIEVQKKKLTDSQFEAYKANYLNKDADSIIINYCESFQYDNSLMPNVVSLITEESFKNNDNKPFKKLPFICKEMNIACNNLVYLLKDAYGLKLSQYFH